MKDTREYRKELIEAGRIAVEELIKVAREKIIKKGEDTSTPLAADRLKNAAATKKLAINDAFDILKRIDEEEAYINDDGSTVNSTKGFAERRAK